MEPLAVDLDRIRAAVPVVRAVAVRTPTVPYLSTDDTELWLKLENLQRLGSFKLRGVWNGLRRMTPEARSHGLVTFSSGNFGLAFGWGSMFVASIIITVMYLGLTYSLAEMSPALPHTGGAYSFARTAMGPWGGFVTGLAESIEMTALLFTTDDHVEGVAAFVAKRPPRFTGT